MNLRVLVAFVPVILLAGCAAQRGRSQVYVPPQSGVQTQAQPLPPVIQAQPVTPTEPSGASAGTPSPPPRNLSDSNPGPAVLALYGQAQQQARGNQYEQAEASLERALGIAPRNPFIWQALANLHLRMKNYQRAATEIQRSDSLAHDNPYLEIGNLRTMAAIRRAQGDDAGAMQAQSQADALSRSLSTIPP